ncbi:MAG: thermonuclease family protein [Nitrospinae bacterium]|nr:thermonuclease family protein [Nitrospinota bacterium]
MRLLSVLVALAILTLALSGVPLESKGEPARPSTGRGKGYRTDYAMGRSEASSARRDGGQFFVKRVIDGDTLRLSDGEKVRLLGVDTPETKHPTKPVQYFGKEASEFTRRAAEGRFVAMDYDVTPRDKYGRLLAYVYRQPDDFFLNAEIIKQGYGFAYTRFPFKYMKEFKRYEDEARIQGRGLWQREPPPAPGRTGQTLSAPDGHRSPSESSPLGPASRRPPSTPVPVPEKLETEPVKDMAVAEEKAAEVKPEADSNPKVADRKEEKGAERQRQDDCRIKGNINRKKEKIYHVPGGQWYGKTQIDESQGERWFCSEEEAARAGWRKAGR